MKNIISFFLITSCIAWHGRAELVSCQAEYLVANYVMSQANEAHQLETTTLSLVRSDKRVAVIDENKASIDVWFKTKQNKLQLTRLFEDFEQGIEYQPSEISQQADWMSKWSLLSQSRLSSMQLIKTNGQGCNQTQSFRFADDEREMSLIWWPKQALIQEFTIKDKTSGQLLLSIRLQDKKHDKAQINARFNYWDSLKTTDYADIGDSENNPFLAKMINQGFVSSSIKHSHHH